MRVDIKKPEDIESTAASCVADLLLGEHANTSGAPSRFAPPRRHLAGGLREFTLPKDKDATAERAKRVKEYQERQQLAARVNAFFVEEGALASSASAAGTTASSALPVVVRARPVSRWAFPSWR